MVEYSQDALERLQYSGCLQTGGDLSQPHWTLRGGGSQTDIDMSAVLYNSVLISRMFICMQLTIAL